MRNCSETLEQEIDMILLKSAVFEFGKKGSKHQPYYLIYDYELDKFYPFVPIIGRQKARNNREEKNMMRAVSNDKLPLKSHIPAFNFNDRLYSSR